MKLFITVLLTSVIISLLSQPAPEIEWQNTIGGSEGDILTSIQQTTEDGFILGGYSWSNISGDKTENSNGWRDYWIIKTDEIGNILWQNSIGGSNHEYLYSIQQTSDGGYIAGGYSDSDISGDKTENSNGENDYWIVKLDEFGNIIWQNTIGGNNNDYLMSVQQTYDNGYILGGCSNSNIYGDKTENSHGSFDYWIIKLDEIGNIVWQNTIGGSGWDMMYSIVETVDNGFILGGSSSSNISGDKTENSIGEYDYWIVKLDESGDIIWQNTIGGSDIDELRVIQQTDDNGYIVGGCSRSNISGDKTENSVGQEDYWIVKLDETGNILWQNTIGGGSADALYAIQQTSDKGYLLGGYSSSNISGDKTENSIGEFDYWVVKLNANGDILWQNTIGGSDTDILYSALQTSDGGYMLGGHSMSNISEDKTENSIGSWDYWMIKLSNDAGISEKLNQIFTIYPNPVETILTLVLDENTHQYNISIYNVDGQKVYNNTEVFRNTTIRIDLSNFNCWVYFVEVTSSVLSQIAKVVVK